MGDRQAAYQAAQEAEWDRILRELLAAILAQQADGRINKVATTRFPPFEHKKDEEKKDEE